MPKSRLPAVTWKLWRSPSTKKPRIPPVPLLSLQPALERVRCCSWRESQYQSKTTTPTYLAIVSNLRQSFLKIETTFTALKYLSSRASPLAAVLGLSHPRHCLHCSHAECPSYIGLSWPYRRWTWKEKKVQFNQHPWFYVLFLFRARRLGFSYGARPRPYRNMTRHCDPAQPVLSRRVYLLRAGYQVDSGAMRPQYMLSPVPCQLLIYCLHGHSETYIFISVRTILSKLASCAYI